MSDPVKEYGQRVAEAVRDACEKAALTRQSISGAKWERFTAGKCAEMVAAIDVAAIVSSVPLPQSSQQQPAAWMYDWIGGNGHQKCVVRDWLSISYDEAHNPEDGCHNIRPLFFTPMAAATPDDLVDHHLDNVLRASGSALRYYTMAKTLEDMRRAMRAAMLDGAPKAGQQGEWPNGATVKLRWVGSYRDNGTLGWAKRDEQGRLVSVVSLSLLDSNSWEVLEERAATVTQEGGAA